MKADYSINCDAKTHNRYKYYASTMTVIYPLGIPSMYLYLLRKSKALLTGGQREREKEVKKEQALKEALIEREKNEEKNPSMKSLEFLYSAYQPKFWWFEVSERCDERSESRKGLYPQVRSCSILNHESITYRFLATFESPLFQKLLLFSLTLTFVYCTSIPLTQITQITTGIRDEP